MPDEFDPYRKWLGIPPAEQPPDYYRLLGIGRFEDDGDTISNAADRQMAHVRTFQTGPHSAVSQKLLNEIAAARVSLLDPAKKAEYDARLPAKAALQSPPPPAAPIARPAVMAPSASWPARATPRDMPVPSIAALPPAIQIRGGTARRKKSSAKTLAIGGALLLAVVVGAIAILGRDRGETGDMPPRTAPPSPDVVASAGGANADASKPGPVAGTVAEQPTPPSLPASEAKLEIIKAEWGEGDRWQDVSKRLQSLVYDERLLVTVGGDLFQGVPDPAFGAVKTGRIRYRAAGREGAVNFSDGELLYLDGHPPEEREPSTNGLQVLEARYGAGRTWIDLLPRLRRWIHADRLAVRVALVAQTDPVPGVRKALLLRYRTSEGEFVTHAWDGEELVLDARPVPTDGKPSDLIAKADTEHVVDLLKLIDLKLDAVVGEWQMTDKGLLSPGGQHARIGIPFLPPDDYELRVVAERTSPGEAFFIGLLVDGRQTSVVLDGWGGKVRGLFGLDGEDANHNATTREGTVFVDERPKELICTVHPSSVHITCDGQVLIDWQGDARRFSSVGNLPDKLGLQLGDWYTKYLIRKLELRPIPPEPPHPPVEPNQPPSEEPRSLGDLAEKPATEKLPSDSRLPVPAGKELVAVEKKVAELFDPQWKAAKNFNDRLAVGRKLFGDGAQTNDNPALRYALLREASRRATALGDAPVVCEALDQLGRDFQIDPLAEKLAALGDALEKAHLPSQIWTLVMYVLPLSDRASFERRYDEARKFASLASVAGRKVRNHDLMTTAERRQAFVRGRQERETRLEKALARLREQPNDEAANLTAGLELCLLHGDWPRGLPLLARSGNPRLAEIAALETAAHQDVSRRPPLVEAWLAEAARQTGAMRSEFELQAKYWLERGLPADAPAPDAAKKRVFDKLTATPGISLARITPGLDMAMFDGGDFQQFRARRIGERMWYNFGLGSPDPSVPGDYFSIRWTGWLKPPLSGKYVIKSNSDDSIRLRINGKPVIDHWNRGAGDEVVEVELSDQLQSLVVEYNDYTDNADVGIRWSLKDLTDFQIIPAGAFFYDPANAR